MGLSFHYSGSFNKDSSLAELIGEVKDIAAINHWKYHIFEQHFPDDHFGKQSYNQKIYGISFSPPESEPVWLCFLSNGKLSNPPNLEIFGNSKDPKEQEFLYMVSVKTQFAGIEAHKKIIDLLRYIGGKYLTDVKVMDEGQYWETGDENLLKEIFNRYDNAMQVMTSALENNVIMPGEDYEQFIQRILRNRGIGN